MAKPLLRALLLCSTIPCAAAAQLQVPSANTTEWQFTGDTNEFVDKVYGPGTLEYADGDGGATDMVDIFTTTSAASIPGVGGVDTPVLFFDIHDPNTMGYLLRPLTGAANNDLFAFTLVYDLYLDPSNADPFGGLVNGSATNSNDAELFLEPATESFYYGGLGGGLAPGAYMRGQWFRLVYAVDWTAGTMECYVNGVLAFSGSPADYLYDGQGDASWILCDNNGEVTSGWLASFAITDVVLTAAEARTLGAPDPAGVFHNSIGTSYCAANPISTGTTASISAAGSAAAAANDLTLTATNMPTNAFGFFLASQGQGFTMNPGGSQGNLCLGGAIGRYVGPGQIQNSGGAGEISLVIDLTTTPTPTGPVTIQAGETWSFQAWHRDAVAGSATSNFTDGLEVAFQ